MNGKPGRKGWLTGSGERLVEPLVRAGAGEPGREGQTAAGGVRREWAGGGEWRRAEGGRELLGFVSGILYHVGVITAVGSVMDGQKQLDHLG